ncbi:MAG: beta-ketoacyl-[acyl-carrier-protein] synthase family protein [Acidimicrobiaceae bacterium]|nr:beta-ketoacyl-[acyl-carrier-protein] synthase family protein [Acidimicrobiaceae bacterium]MCO4833951.1 beta-ketoacyl-[acyl-carrier-protein] synthase family protein [Acidimicrobiaceae bacterium]MDC1389629.1 beta-ketoacyl-[acyl-carrier-protein] synthase family protein [Acidimicrobiales bacterium]
MSQRRVVITGASAVATAGLGREAFFDGLLAPAPDERPRNVHELDLTAYFETKEARRLDRHAQFALIAAAEALAEAGDLPYDPERIGSLVGTGVGGMRTFEEQVLVQHEKGSRRVSPFLIPMMMANASSAHISMKYGFEGPCETTVTACAASNQSIGNALNMIRWDRCDAMVTGGTESSTTVVGLAGFQNMTALSSSGQSRPFDADRDGFIAAEAAGVLVIEELEGAKARGATILAEILGYATTADAHHITAPSPGGVGAIKCMTRAIADAGLQPSDIAYVNAHGTSTPLNDAAEAQACAQLFGTPGPYVTSIKGVTGHSLGAAGAIEAVSVVESMIRGIIPPTANTTAVDPELPPINVVLGQGQEWTPGPTISNSFGFGGHNASLVFGPAPH